MVTRAWASAGTAKSPAAMFDMCGLADNALDQHDFLHRPADRRDLLAAEPVAAIVDRHVRFGRGAEHHRGFAFEKMTDQRRLECAGLRQRCAGAQRDGLSVLDPIEGEREGWSVDAVERGDHRRKPFGRRVMEVEQRYQGDVEQVRAAAGIVAGERGDLRLRFGRRLGHDVERVTGAHMARRSR